MTGAIFCVVKPMSLICASMVFIRHEVSARSSSGKSKYFRIEKFIWVPRRKNLARIYSGDIEEQLPAAVIEINKDSDEVEI